jgi:citrate lyase subunit beta/citryl-CoA lyase
MNKRPQRSRRVQLAVPGSSEKMMGKAAGSRADHVFLDLEDAVAPREKVASRARVVEALNTLDWSGKTTCVRINDLTTQWAYEDIIAVVEGAHARLDTIMLPKARSASDVLFVDTMLSQIEKKLKLDRRIGIEVLIEEVEGMLNVEEIARSCDRLEALIFGMGDYSASQGIDPKVIAGKSGYPGDAWHYGRWKIAIAARAAGIDAIDGPFPDFRDSETYSEECRRGLLLGFVGKWAIHPAQIDPALAVFTPDRDAVAKARRMVEVYAQAERDGLGAVAMDGEMVDAATVRMVQDMLKRAEAAGM